MTLPKTASDIGKPIAQDVPIGAEVAKRLSRMGINIRHYLKTELKHRQNGRDPKPNGFCFAEVPDWQLRQWADLIDDALSPSPHPPHNLQTLET